MKDAMRRFREGLLRYEEYICKLAFLDSLEVEDGQHWEFTLVARWKDGGELGKCFTREYVLGNTAARPPLEQRPRMRTCRFRDEFIRAVLAARGI